VHELPDNRLTLRPSLPLRGGLAGVLLSSTSKVGMAKLVSAWSPSMHAIEAAQGNVAVTSCCVLKASRQHPCVDRRL